MSELTDKFKASLRSWANTFFTPQNLLTFSLFVLLAMFMWLSHALNTTRENTFHVPLSYEGIGDSICFDTPLPDHINVRLRDQGSRLRAYTDPLSKPITLDLHSQLQQADGEIHISADVIRPRLSDLLQGTTKLQEVTPEDVEVHFHVNSKKNVPIVFGGMVETAKQYELCGDLTIDPSTIFIYGKEALINSIDTVFTAPVSLTNVKDTVVAAIELNPIEGVQFENTTVTLTAIAERYTEKVLTLPLEVRDLPKNKKLRLFPTTTELRIKVAMRNFTAVNEHSIHPYVVFPTTATPRLSVQVSLDSTLATIVRINPADIEYIIEDE